MNDMDDAKQRRDVRDADLTKLAFGGTELEGAPALRLTKMLVLAKAARDERDARQRLIDLLTLRTLDFMVSLTVFMGMSTPEERARLEEHMADLKAASGVDS